MSGEANNWDVEQGVCLSPERGVRSRALELYEEVADLPVVSPHGHLTAALFSGGRDHPSDPASLFVTGDPLVTRLLYAHGVPYEELGVPPRDGSPYESDPRKVWRRFCERFHLFDGTPTGLWLKLTLVRVFGVNERPSARNADRLFDRLSEALASAEFAPRQLLKRFKVEYLATTDPATASLDDHISCQAAGMGVVPTFRPDALMQLSDPSWTEQVALLGERVGFAIDSLAAFVEALRRRRLEFRERGATSSDHGVTSAFVDPLDNDHAAVIFDRARSGQVGPEEAGRFHSHMLFEMAHMATEDGLVMQLHLGSLRNHHQRVMERFGPDRGADVPVAVDLTRGLQPLLNAFGYDQRFRLVVYTLDESTYGRELAPLAGHYPALRLGGPWWFHDSVHGIERYLAATAETAGFHKLAGYVDDARSLPTLRARHEVWRRVTCDWLARLELRGLIGAESTPRLANWLAYGAAKDAFRIPSLAAAAAG
ncbi:MAG TPA: glucuronate isomerase [Trueperaceae bacterium]